MKAVRIVLYALAGAVVLLVVAAVIIVRSFDLNDYKDEITAYVQDRTGRTLAIDENIEFSLFPWFAVETGGVSLSDDPEFGDRSIATIDSLSARVRVWPLLKRRIEIGRVVLDGINLNLGIDAEGRGNWSTLLQTSVPEPPASGPPQPQRPSIEQLAVEGIDIRNARILWHDANGEVVYIVRDLTVGTGPIHDSDPVDVAVSLSLLDVASQASIDIEFQSIAALRPTIEVRDVDGTVRLLDPRQQERGSATIALGSISRDGDLIRTGPASIASILRNVPFGQNQLDVDATIAAIELNTETEALTVGGFSARIGALDANLDVRGESVLSDPQLSGTIEIVADTMTGLFDTLGRETPADLRTANVGGLAASAQFDLSVASQSLTIPRFAVSALGLEATGNGALGADRVLAATIQVPAFRPGNSLVSLIEARLPDGVDVGAIRSADLTADLEFRAASGGLDVPAYTLHLDNTTLAGRLAVDAAGAPNRITGRLSANGLDNRQLAALFGPWLPDELVATDLGQFRLDTDFTWSSQSRIAEFAPLQLMAYGLSGEGQLTVVTANDTLTLSGRAALAEFSPRALLQRFELPVPQTSDPTVLRSAELAASFETSGARGEFRDIAVELDESRITGEFNVDDFANPAYRFVLRADRIDADRYLPPKAEPVANAGATTEKRLGDMNLTSESLTRTNVTGTASVGHLTIGGMDFDQFAADLSFGGGRAALTPVRTQLYGGTFDGGLAIDASGDLSRVRLTGDLRRVNIRPLLEDLLGSAYLSGTGDLKLDLTGRGNTINEALQSAAGSLGLEFTDGTIDGVNLGRRLCAAANSARRLPAPAAAPATTRFTVIRGNATVSEGSASSSDLYASTGFLDLTGRGSLRLVDQWIDNQYRATMTGPIPIAGCEDLNRTITNNPIPVNFTLQGQLPDLEVGVDINQLLQDWARREVRQRAEDEVRGAILDRLLN